MRRLLNKADSSKKRPLNDLRASIAALDLPQEALDPVPWLETQHYCCETEAQLCFKKCCPIYFYHFLSKDQDSDEDSECDGQQSSCNSHSIVALQASPMKAGIDMKDLSWRDTKLMKAIQQAREARLRDTNSCVSASTCTPEDASSKVSSLSSSSAKVANVIAKIKGLSLTSAEKSEQKPNPHPGVNQGKFEGNKVDSKGPSADPPTNRALLPAFVSLLFVNYEFFVKPNFAFFYSKHCLYRSL